MKLYDRVRRGSDVSVHSLSNISEFRDYRKSGIGQDLVTAKILHNHNKNHRKNSENSNQVSSHGYESPLSANVSYNPQKINEEILEEEKESD